MIYILLLLALINFDPVVCEILTLDKKLDIIAVIIHDTDYDFYCYLLAKFPLILDDLDSLNTTQDIFRYFKLLEADFFKK